VLDPGANPRAVLQLRPNTTAESRALTFSTEITQSGASSATVGPIQIRTVVSTPIGTAGPNGTIRLPYSYGPFQLLDTSTGTPDQLAATRSSLAQFQGMSGDMTLSSSGAVLSNHFAIPPAVSSTVRSLLNQLSNQSSQLTVPLPTKPVGTGARWRVTTQLTVSGLKVHQTYDYKLVSHDGSRLTLDVHYTQVAPRQHVTLAGTPAGVSVDVTSFHVAGTGRTVLDLTRVIPLSGHLAAQGLEQFGARQGTRTLKIDQRILTGVDFAPA
jgi:hypothetical protein